MISSRQYQSIEQQLASGDPEHCSVCERKLPVLAARRAAHCSRAKCRSLFAQFRVKRERLQACEHKRPGGPAELALRKRLGAERDRQARRQGVAPDAIAVALLPANSRALVPLPDRRKRQFLAHLDRLLAEVARARAEGRAGEFPSSAGAFAERTPSAALAPLVGSLCGTCGGQCCTTASSHAYLNAADVRDKLERGPQRTAEELVARYVEHFPEVGYEDSCVFHGERGCTLPNELRGEMCNRFLCRGLEWLEAELGPRATAVLATSTEDGAIVREARIECPRSEPAEEGSVEADTAGPDDRAR